MSAKHKDELIHEIVTRQMHRNSTAAVLFHQALAERLGLGPTDHKVFDLLREHGPMSGSELVALTGITSGAITGVINRLEQAKFVRREADAKDGRRQILSPQTSRIRELHAVFHPLHQELANVLEKFDTRQLEAIAQFLIQGTDLLYRHSAVLRAYALAGALESRRLEEKPNKTAKRVPR
ncbi:MarR family transcriptional regulator [Dyella sp.]|uniref:MarR family winged helix-turn-helix transcriptional regulator n=1 Tax=Dyella sp. TaxID=1869338 RepID=UPI002B91EA79|nr:MarR family transcriptional regulator [Rhodanobacteraceae bacterium]